MKTNSLFWAMSWVAVGSFAIMQGCGGDDDDDGGGDGNGGKGGSSGSSTGGSATGGSATGGRGGSTTGGSSTGGSTTGGSSGAAGAPGGAGGDDTGGGGEGGSSGGDRAAVCADYCSTYFDTGCQMYDGGFYGTEAGCQSLCEQAVWALGEPGDAMGNSVHCRLSHAEFAADASDPTTHCGHAAADSTGNCVP